MNQLVSIIIVNYNGKHFLQGCLESVLRQEYRQFEVILVDNASKDGSAEFVAERFPDVRVIRNTTNLGFAGGNNAGVQIAEGDLIVLLNNDTVVHPGWLQGLVNAVIPGKVPLASSLIKTAGIPDKYYEKNGSINFLGYNVMRIFDNPSDIFYAGGASLIFQKSIFGLPFADEYFVYGEDVYLGLRARFMGYTVVHTNESRLEHFGSGTAKEQKNAFLTFYQERNRILNVLLFFSLKTIIKTVPYFALNFVGKSVLAALPSKYSLTGVIKAYGWIFLHSRTVLELRNKTRAEQTVDENDVIAFMTGKLTNGESVPGKIINALSVFYCTVVRLSVMEVRK